jgi:hypothetical protein
MPIIRRYGSPANFGGNRIGVRAPDLSLMPGLQLWWFPRTSLEASPNQAPGGPAPTVMHAGMTFTDTYVTMPGSSTDQIAFDTGIHQATNFTVMMVARSSATAHYSSLFNCVTTGPSTGFDLYLYHVGNLIQSSVTGPQSGTPPTLALSGAYPAGASKDWGFYALRCHNGYGVTQFAKTDGDKTANTLSAIAPTLSAQTIKIGTDVFSGLANAAFDFCFASIIAGPTTDSALSDALVEQCYQSVKYSLSFDDIPV